MHTNTWSFRLITGSAKSRSVQVRARQRPGRTRTFSAMLFALTKYRNYKCQGSWGISVNSVQAVRCVTIGPSIDTKFNKL